jgi:aminoglycoside phosphotransferase (APT) family kinase protein
MRETVYYQKGMPDPIFDENQILDIIHKYVPTAKTLKSIDEDGGEARVYIIDNNVVLKVQRPQQLRSSTSLEKEVFFLNQLEKETDVVAPRVLGYGKDGTLEYICMTKIQGIKVEYTRLIRDEKTALLLVLGKELRKIHGIDQSTIKKSGLFPCDDPPDLKERIKRRYQSALMKKKDSISSHELDLSSAAIDKELQNINDVDTFVGLHVNPYICHILVDEKTHQYTGLIDFGDAYIGHPIFDMWYWKVESRKTLLKGYTSERPVSAAFQIIFDTLNTISQKITPLLQTSF